MGNDRPGSKKRETSPPRCGYLWDSRRDPIDVFSFDLNGKRQVKKTNGSRLRAVRHQGHLLSMMGNGRSRAVSRETRDPARFGNI